MVEHVCDECSMYNDAVRHLCGLSKPATVGDLENLKSELLDIFLKSINDGNKKLLDAIEDYDSKR